jgi:hypothetical protein
VNTAHCPGCGRSSAECSGCLPALDPPRYCTTCGTWLAVRVSTGGWVARCRTCDTETTAAG